MTTLIFVIKENGEPGIRVASKERLKLGSRTSVKVLDGRSWVSTSHVCKMFDFPTALPKATRKSLGTVNRATKTSIKTEMPQRQTSLPKR